MDAYSDSRDIDHVYLFIFREVLCKDQVQFRLTRQFHAAYRLRSACRALERCLCHF